MSGQLGALLAGERSAFEKIGGGDEGYGCHFSWECPWMRLEINKNG